MKQTTDIGRLVEAAQRGDGQACGVLVKRCGQPVFSLLLRMGIDTLDAEELTQDVLLRGLQHIDDYDPIQASLPTWFCRIAYRMALNHLRRKEVQPLSVDADEGVTDEANLQMVRHYQEPDNSMVDRLQEAIGLLDPDEQTLISLFYYDELPLRDIAYITGQSANALAVRLYRIRQKLHKWIKHESS
ncbi:MAG: sigma-70 family RNA polymerase sigma factor [Bacteroidaceae bacterium]|nr:sigma-70 family RNA polymerase sigma factor [Bacteroidaceae bacterium]